MEKKFEIKDLITVVIFTALYFAITLAVACIGFIPIFMVFMPLLVPIFAGIPLMLYFSKITKDELDSVKWLPADMGLVEWIHREMK